MLVFPEVLNKPVILRGFSRTVLSISCWDFKLVSEREGLNALNFLLAKIILEVSIWQQQFMNKSFMSLDVNHDKIMT
ncbi:MAG: hypothetical protein VYB22_11410, partial [Pseudomonadota bacterium]|nr:hypothetical protein [Pseudomonadota bacterium]